ncbi:MAG: peptide ABC transporter, partial [Bacteroidota bacterium]
IDEKEIDQSQIGEYFGTIFNPIHLFEKLYGVDTSANMELIKEYLDVFHLSDKVHIKDGHYSTLRLSQGQRKRLALLQCMLEDRPIFMFDEWTADQDPGYRKFFYDTLIPRMKQEGKMIIAITHDDQYFHHADKVLKLDMGQQVQFSLREKEHA